MRMRNVVNLSLNVRFVVTFVSLAIVVLSAPMRLSDVDGAVFVFVQ